MSSTTRTLPSLRGHDRWPRAGYSALSAEGRASSWDSDEKATVGRCEGHRATSQAGRIYLEAVVDRYLWLPGTPSRVSGIDRRLTGTLYERGVPLVVVHAALLLGAARRLFRAEGAPPLPPIRTLHYFLPLIEEVLEHPPASGYVEYLERKLLPWADAKAEKAGWLKSK